MRENNEWFFAKASILPGIHQRRTRAHRSTPTLWKRWVENPAAALSAAPLPQLPLRSQCGNFSRPEITVEQRSWKSLESKTVVPRVLNTNNGARFKFAGLRRIPFPIQTCIQSRWTRGVTRTNLSKNLTAVRPGCMAVS